MEGVLIYFNEGMSGYAGFFVAGGRKYAVGSTIACERSDAEDFFCDGCDVGHGRDIVKVGEQWEGT